ncbi:MAG: Gfo/Idh/MocA family protein [Pseudomonadota bacterium]
MLRAGIIGIGRWGRQLVSSVQGKSAKIRFTAGATGRKDRALSFAKENGIALRDSLADLLADRDIDAVVLATPHTLHAEQMKAAAAAGKHVFVDKPFTLTRASAEDAAQACARAGTVCALGHNRRFLPAMVKLRSTVAGGSLGKVLHVEGNMSGDFAYRYTPDHWRGSTAESPAGGMTGMGIHMVDAFLSFLGPIASVTAMSQGQVLTIGLDDTTTMLFRFRAGSTGYLGTMQATPRFWRLHVFLSEGWIEMRGDSQIVVRRRGADAPDETTDFPPFDSIRAELDAFADAAGGGPAYPLPLAEAVHGAAVLEAVVESARTGTTIGL